MKNKVELLKRGTEKHYSKLTIMCMCIKYFSSTVLTNRHLSCMHSVIKHAKVLV